MPSIFDPEFKYTPSYATDIKKRLNYEYVVKNGNFHKTLVFALVNKKITIDQMNVLIDIYNKF